MSMAIAHFAFGAAATTLVVALLVPASWYPRTLTLVGGGWAMLPDLHWISPVATEQLRELHGTSPWVDLFWFHRTLDTLDATDSTGVAAVFVALFIGATLFAEWWGYRSPARVRKAHETYLGVERPK
ncbi:hypothetical protein ACFQL1_15640 [Halomicroarcula sp. GCM10025709]|uniref:hypothetical protein n=1 Tax=Haloarcula TaxID=2237 RepID=UPI0024C39667|nr:hypothetical protein [Halomicroarcula sp. YJ-61-S]